MNRMTAVKRALCCVGLLTAAMFMAAAGEVSAQGSSAGRAYRGLFGAGSLPSANGHTLDFTATVYGEDGIYPQSADVDDAGNVVQQEGFFGGVRAGLTYRKRSQRVSFGLTAEGSGRYYQDDKVWTEPAFKAETGLAVNYGRNAESRFQLNGGYEYLPYYTLSLLQVASSVAEGSALTATSRDDLLFRQDRHVATASMRVEQGLGRRGVWSLEASGRDVTSPEPLYEAREMRAGGSLGYRTSRYSTWRVGYIYQRGEYGYKSGGPLTSHIIDLGLDYRRPLPKMRKTTFSMSTGSGFYDTDEGQNFRVVGTAALRHDFDGGWYLQTEYKRDVQVVEGFTAPFLSDGVTASLGGLVGRRVEILTSGGYSTGDVGFDGQHYDVVQASARLRVALSRFAAIEAEGLAYKYNFSASDVAVTPIGTDYTRNAVRIQLTIWVPFAR
jgi:hypothetical protein